MSNPIDPLIKNLDARKKTRTIRQYPVPGLIATEMMLAERETHKSDPSVAKSRLNEIKELLKK